MHVSAFVARISLVGIDKAFFLKNRVLTNSDAKQRKAGESRDLYVKRGS